MCDECVFGWNNFWMKRFRVHVQVEEHLRNFDESVIWMELCSTVGATSPPSGVKLHLSPRPNTL